MSSGTKEWVWPAPDDDGICTSQTLGAAGALSIDGALLDVNLQWRTGNKHAVMAASRLERVVSLTSTGNLSGVNFTITGIDSNYQAVTETRAGPNNSTVETTATFMRVYSVTANGAVGTAVKVGSGTTGFTGWFPVNTLVTPTDIGLGLVLANTINVTVQHTFRDVLAGDTVASTDIFSHSSLVSKTSSADGNYAYPPAAFRAKVNSSTDGTMTFTAAIAG